MLKRAAYNMMTKRTLKRSENRPVVIGVCYHRFEVLPKDDPLPGMAITPERFAKQIQWMREVGTIAPLDDLYSGPLSPGIHFFVSFDDGYEDNLTTLTPILRARRIPCTLFVTADFVRGTLPRFAHDEAIGFAPSALSPGQLREAADVPGVTIGCHTATHPRLTTFDRETWLDEWAGSKRWLEGVVERPVEHAAYPFGGKADFDWKPGGRFLHEQGYRTISSNFGGWNDPNRPDRLVDGGKGVTHLRRVPAPNVEDREIFLGWVLGMAAPRDGWSGGDLCLTT